MKFDFSYSRLSSAFGRCFHCTNMVVALLSSPPAQHLGHGHVGLGNPFQKAVKKAKLIPAQYIMSFYFSSVVYFSLISSAPNLVTQKFPLQPNL